MELDALILAWNFFSVSVLEFVSNEGSSDAVHKRMRVWVFTLHITYRVLHPADTKYEYESLYITKYCKTLSEQPAQNIFE